MGRTRSAILVGVAAVLVALIVAPGASARHLHVHVNIKDQNGYRMSIEASRSARRVIQIASSKIEGPNASPAVRAISRRHAVDVARAAKVRDAKPRRPSGFISVQVQNHHAISTYNVQGTVTHNRLFAKLGDLGRISLHFHLRHTRTTRRGCSREHERLGVFRGQVRFRGEDQYVDVDANELKGKVEMERGLSGRCTVLVLPATRHPKAGPKAKAGSRHHHADYAVLFAHKESTARPALFAAVKAARKSADFLAASLEFRDPVFIEREEYREGRAGDFRISKGLKTARIEPSPRAFRGSGHFRAHHVHSRWKGSLATSFPGAAHVRLAGRKFEAKLRQLDFSY
jgi:hypothetical protein